MGGRILSVNLSGGTAAPWASGPQGRSGIDKRPVSHPVAVRTLGLTGDHIGDPSRHGGPDQAVYAYAREDADWWERELGRTVPPGGLGENLTTEGLDVTGALLGERWLVGSTLLEVSLPRIPCATLANFWQVPDLVVRFTRRATPGAYLRVLREGEISTDDPVEVVERPAHGVTVGMGFRALTGEVELLPRLLAVTSLPDWVRARIARRVGRSFH